MVTNRSAWTEEESNGSFVQNSAGTQVQTRISWLVVKNERATRQLSRPENPKPPHPLMDGPSQRGGPPSLKCFWADSSNIYAPRAQTGSFIRQIKDLLHSPPAPISIYWSKNKRPLHQSKIRAQNSWCERKKQNNENNKSLLATINRELSIKEMR